MARCGEIVKTRRWEVKRVSIVSVLLFAMCVWANATIILHQGFESTQDDDWMYVADPVPSRQYWWGPTEQNLGGAIAESGSWYLGKPGSGHPDAFSVI
jgi:hypothetical protein